MFASDAISSTAYATEEILFVLMPVAGMAALSDLVPIAWVVVVLLVIVITSYRQTIHAYPGGGGSYLVSRENLGETPSLVAGASLLVDYVLTVAVSISAGVAPVVSAFGGLLPFQRRTSVSQARGPQRRRDLGGHGRHPRVVLLRGSRCSPTTS